MDLRALRIACGLSVEKAAVYSGVSSPTIRLYEANPANVRPATRARLDPYYQGLMAKHTAGQKPAKKAP